MPEGMHVFSGGMPCEKGVELDQVCVLRLGIDLPDEGLGGPLGADEGILTADEI
jgi:hypothetical protein